jgi:hypothetical protein
MNAEFLIFIKKCTLFPENTLEHFISGAEAANSTFQTAGKRETGINKLLAPTSSQCES